MYVKTGDCCLTLTLLTCLLACLPSVLVPTCNKCNKRPVVFNRLYSGEVLCKSCFIQSIEKKTLHTISRYSMINYGQRVAVGVSGGKDSLVLLYILKKISKNNNNDIIAITIDEGIEGLP